VTVGGRLFQSRLRATRNGFRTKMVNDSVRVMLEFAIFEGWMEVHLPGVVQKVRRPRSVLFHFLLCCIICNMVLAIAKLSVHPSISQTCEL